MDLTPQLRITVNSRCQKACFYCRPAGEGSDQNPSYEMTTDEIVRVVRQLARHGIRDVKLTGGDPVLKNDIVDLVRQIKLIDGITSVHLVTRHHRAGFLSHQLSEAGLDCLNFSLDTLKPDMFRAITGVNSHHALIDAIRRSVPVSKSVKVNTVVMSGINDSELMDLVRFCEDAKVDTLKLLDLILDLDPELSTENFASRLHAIVPGKQFEDLYFPLDGFASKLSAMAVRQEVSRQPGGLGHPMMTYWLPSGLMVQVKDARRGAWYGDVCKGCPLFPCHDAIMALRLTSDGKLQRCLSRSDNLVDLRTPVSEGDVQVIDAMITQVLRTYKEATFYPVPLMPVQALYPLD